MRRTHGAAEIEAELIGRIYDTTLDPSLWPAVVKDVTLAMSGNYAGIFFFHPRTKLLTHEIANHFPQREAFIEHFARLDPRNEFGLRQRAGTTFVDAAFIDRPTIARNEFYQDYLLPNDMGHVGAHILQNDADGIAGIAVQRPIRLPPFERAELDVLERLAPHLLRALRLQVRLGEAATQSPAWTLDLLHGLRWGIVALDDVLRPLFVNRMAEGLLTKADGIRLDRQGLHAMHPWDGHQLRKILAQALAGTGGELRVRRPSGEPDWIVSVAPTRGPADRAQADCAQTMVRIVVHLLDPSSRPTCPPKRLHALFDLSPAEARVAAGLMSGLSASEIAARNGVAACTVRTQLEQLFIKTGTQGQRGLLALLRTVAQLP